MPGRIAIIKPTSRAIGIGFLFLGLNLGSLPLAAMAAGRETVKTKVKDTRTDLMF